MVALDTPTERQAAGIRDGKLMKLVCAFDIETWQQVRQLAVEKKISVAEQVRRLVEIGLDSDVDLEAIARQADNYASGYEREAGDKHQRTTVPEPQLSKLKAAHWRILAKFIREQQ